VALAVAVALDLDARHHALGDRDLLAADRIADHRDAIAQVGQLTQLGRLDSVEEVAIVDADEREVAVVADADHARDRLLRIGDLLHLEEGAVRDDVGAGQDAPGTDDHARPGARLRYLRLPRRIEVGILGGGVDSNDGEVGHRGLHYL
jgi:hypothetical protein